MADVQLENGYTRVANEILENLVRMPLNGTQFRIIMTIWRATYGFNRKEGAISEMFLSKALGIARPHVHRELKPLFDKKILTIVESPTFNRAAVIAFNKNYDEWQSVLSRQQVPNTVTGTELGTATGTELGTQKKKVIKKDINRELVCEKDDFSVVISSYTTNESLRGAIHDFVRHRRTIKNPMSAKALTLLLSKLDSFGYDDALKIQCLNESILNGWRGVFELKGENGALITKPPGTDPYRDINF